MGDHSTDPEPRRQTSQPYAAPRARVPAITVGSHDQVESVRLACSGDTYPLVPSWTMGWASNHRLDIVYPTMAAIHGHSAR